MNNQYAEIIPLRRLIRNLTVFDYKVPEKLQKEIKRGQLVSIYFQKAKFLGVISKLKGTTPIPQSKLKEISGIVQKEPVVTAEQFKLADWISDYYFVAKSIVLKSIVPDFPKKPLESKMTFPVSEASLKISRNIVPWITAEIKKYSLNKNKIFSLTSPQKTVLYAFYSGLLKKNIASQKVSLIIVPDHQEFNSIFPLINATDAAYLTSQLTRKEYFQQWEKVWKGKAKVIIGTRLAMFLPFTKLDQIIVHLEEDENHKNADQNPRFHVREVAKELAQNYQAKLLLTSQTPSLEIFNEVRNGTIKSVSSPPLPPDQIDLVSREEEIKKGNYSSLSENLQELMKKMLAQKKTVFLFLNRKGVAASYFCQDCHWLARCSNCSLAYTVDENNYLLCRHCNKKESMPLQCPNCQGNNLKTLGKGIHAVEKELREFFPNTEISRVDQGTSLKNSYSGIIIGTEFALRNLRLQNIGLIGIISSDNLLHLPDFRSEEKTYQLINRVVHFSSAPVPSVIQTFAPENKAIRAASKQDFRAFADKELEIRTALHWPPVWSLVKLINRPKEAKMAEKEAYAVHKTLTQTLKSASLELLEPMPLYLPPQKGKCRWQLILKIKGKKPPELSKLTSLIPTDWVIDPDPLTIL